MDLHHGFVLLLKGTGVMFSSFFSFLITWIVIIIAAVVAKEL